jgi:hypothetical protein
MPEAAKVEVSSMLEEVTTNDAAMPEIHIVAVIDSAMVTITKLAILVVVTVPAFAVAGLVVEIAPVVAITEFPRALVVVERAALRSLGVVT